MPAYVIPPRFLSITHISAFGLRWHGQRGRLTRAPPHRPNEGTRRYIVVRWHASRSWCEWLEQQKKRLDPRPKLWSRRSHLRMGGVQLPCHDSTQRQQEYPGLKSSRTNDRQTGSASSTSVVGGKGHYFAGTVGPGRVSNDTVFPHPENGGRIDQPAPSGDTVVEECLRLEQLSNNRA